MSSREPLWYCHECHAEMRPLMVPDPHCASCNGTFVEKMENPADDPREYMHMHGGPLDDDALPGEMDNFLSGLRGLLGGARPNAPPPPMGQRPSSPLRPASPFRPDRPSNSAFTIRIQNGGRPGMSTVIIGGDGPHGLHGPHSPHAERGGIPSLSEFNGNAGNTRNHNTITGPLMAQYLLAMLSSRPGRAEGMGDPFGDFMPNFGLFGPEGGPGENGRWGDYVFNQEALDQIISQIMENNNAHAPVAASEEAMQKLPREVLVEGSPLLEKDCAVCKEQFKLGTEDPDEQVVVTLPCKHPFHEPCIMPWLKSSGTCPVCRYQLVPQPDAGAPGPGPPRNQDTRPDSPNRPRSSGNGSSSGSGSGANRPSSPSSPRRAASPPRNNHTGSGLFNFFHFGGGHRNRDDTSGRRSSDSGGRRSSGSGGRQERDDGYVPGSWGDSVD